MSRELSCVRVRVTGSADWHWKFDISAYEGAHVSFKGIELNGTSVGSSFSSELIGTGEVVSPCVNQRSGDI